MSATYPFNAITNKATWLLRIGGPSVWLAKGQGVTVLGEDNGWGTVRAVVKQETVCGSVDQDDYDAV